MTPESYYTRRDTDKEEMLVSRMAPRYDLPKAAPDELRRVQLFVNTTDHETGRELLDSPHGLGTWLAEQGLLRPGARVRNVDLQRAKALRDALRTLLEAQGPGREEAAAELNRTGRVARLELEATPSGTAKLSVSASGVDGALGSIVAAALQGMLDGRWSRLKPCRNCGWIYYDYSRNRAATWCSMSICGNRHKTRLYRERVRGREARRPSAP
jgi:predicted RNA-binding Zn ribbon-like protein